MRLHFSSMLATLAGGCLLTACSPVEGDAGAEEPARQQLLKAVEGEDAPARQQSSKPVEAKDARKQVESCLLLVWSEEEEPDIEFDRAHDVVKGGAISCAMGVSPSRFAAAIGALREAAQQGDKARILEQLGVPLLYIDENGERQDLGEEQIEALFDDIFDPRMLDMLRRLDLSQMTVQKEQGAFFELGTLWLVVDESGRPQVVTVNRQALVEAAEAARDQSDLGQGRPIKQGN